MTTWLEYVAYKLMGPPRYTRGNGESFWECPRCGSYKWHTRPSNQRYKDRFSCYRCDWWGDINDLAEEFASDVTIRLDMWRKEYDVHGEDTSIVPDRPGRKIYGGGGSGRSRHSPISSPGGSGSSSLGDDDPKKIMEASANLSKAERELMAVAYQLARNQGVDPGALAYDCWHGREWIAETNIAHMSECEDKECDWCCCRAARGLPPPTPEDIAEWQRQAAEERRLAAERQEQAKARAQAKFARMKEQREAERQRRAASRNGRVKRR
jgi:hypothetical protein